MLVGLGTLFGICLTFLPATSGAVQAKPQLIYFVMLDRFSNGDPTNDLGGLTGPKTVTGFDPTNTGFYQGGDIRGLINHISYIKSLGFTTIWVTPVVRQQTMAADEKSTAYHGYWGVGFDQVDPHLGTMSEFKEFVADSHAADMKVILDIVVNHTADVIHSTQGGDYVNIADQPYRTSDGKGFDSVSLAGTTKFPALDKLNSIISFPKPPILDPSSANIKSPAWLNDVRNYHNRGNVGTSEESMLYGDFYGLDDLFTESPTVVSGWISVFSNWIKDTDIDGFRIDTARHVNTQFWNAFLPAMRKVALTQGKTYFPMWGEIFDTDPRATSYWVKNASYTEVLDFPLQSIVVNYVNEANANLLGSFFNTDDLYITANTDASTLGTFLGNHDMGRIGSFIVNRANTGEVALQRDQMAHVLLYTLRGTPMEYYGDEFGLTGGGDKEARQSLFPTQISWWQNQYRIGSDSIGDRSSFDTTNPLQETIRTLTSLRTNYSAFATGSQKIYYADGGILIFSRFDALSHNEYLVALNASDQTGKATFNDATVNQNWNLLAGSATATVSRRRTTVTLQPRQWGVFAPTFIVPASRKILTAIYSISLDSSDPTQLVISATAKNGSYLSVEFNYRINGGKWISLGKDGAASFASDLKENGFYRVYPLISQFPKKVPIEFRTITTDSYGVSAISAVKKFTIK